MKGGDLNKIFQVLYICIKTEKMTSHDVFMVSAFSGLMSIQLLFADGDKEEGQM